MKKILPYQFGDTRTIKKFLWMPKTIGCERRWLEFAKIKQRFNFYMGFIFFTIEDWTDLYWDD